MKLSKQERIAAIVVIVLIILVAGVFLFIKPNIETINETKSTLNAKKAEYEEDAAKVEQKGELRDKILEAYNDGKNMADMFFPELASYEADNEFRAFLEKCSENGNAHVLVEDLTVSAPMTAGLSTSVFVPSEVQYALKDYVNQGSTVDITTIDPRLIRQVMIQLKLGEPQSIGATTVTFNLQATTVEDILAFTDEVNRYEKDENGKSIRKAIELNGISITDLRTEAEYKNLTDALQKAAEAAGKAEFRDEYGVNIDGTTGTTGGDTPTPTVPTDPDGTIGGNGGNGGDNPNNNNEKLEYHYFSIPCTITFYSIERMQDPTPTLDEQDKAAS